MYRMDCPNCDQTLMSIMCEKLEYLELNMVCPECRADLEVKFDMDG